VLKGGHLVVIADCAATDVLAWKALLGDVRDSTRIEALAEAMQLLQDVFPETPSRVYYDPRPYIAANAWTFASTMPRNPHEYLMLRDSSDWREHLRFLRWIRSHGRTETFEGRQYKYQTVDEWRYWALAPNDTILNRHRVAPGLIRQPDLFT
jgi:hypothetical protein